MFFKVRIFCIYTAVAVLFTYIYHITFFGGCMAFFGHAEKRNLHGLICVPVMPKSLAGILQSKCMHSLINRFMVAFVYMSIKFRTHKFIIIIREIITFKFYISIRLVLELVAITQRNCKTKMHQ